MPQMSDNVVIRRATHDDYHSVIKIIDDLWDGFDYLPTLYHSLLQTTNNVFYVAEVDKKVVITNTSIFLNINKVRLSNFIFHVFFIVCESIRLIITFLCYFLLL